jgi:hypothetical protein
MPVLRPPGPEALPSPGCDRKEQRAKKVGARCRVVRFFTHLPGAGPSPGKPGGPGRAHKGRARAARPRRASVRPPGHARPRTRQDTGQTTSRRSNRTTHPHRTGDPEREILHMPENNDDDEIYARICQEGPGILRAAGPRRTAHQLPADPGGKNRRTGRPVPGKSRLRRPRQAHRRRPGRGHHGPAAMVPRLPPAARTSRPGPCSPHRAARSLNTRGNDTADAGKRP